jgi:hypothetical protein
MVAGQDMSSIHERIDRSCDLLRSAYRRRVIYALRRNGPSMTDELADAVVSADVSDDRKRVLASLVHTHLPKLAEADVVEYDGPEELVSLSDGVEDLEPLLSVAAREEGDLEMPSAVEGCATNVVSTGPE